MINQASVIENRKIREFKLKINETPRLLAAALCSRTSKEQKTREK